MNSLIVPRLDGSTTRVEIANPVALDTASSPATSRRVYAAAHVVATRTQVDDEMLAYGACGQIQDRQDGTAIDWDATMRLRHRIWGLGLGVAESMDTSQRGMGLSAEQAMELGRRSVREARSVGADVVVGVGTDDLPPGPATVEDIVGAYLRQIEQIEGEGGSSVMMASRNLASSVTHAEEYLEVYDAVLSQVGRPVVLHWLGDMFDPALAGYWGADNPADAVPAIVELISRHADKVQGIKVSVLDDALEVELRNKLPEGVLTFTGDDYHYVDLISGDGDGHSHALLGAFAAVAPYASAALKRLDAGDIAGYRAILGPTEALSRLVFAAPTQYYKVGIAWLAYLDGLQDEFLMLDRFERNRAVEHLGELVVEANKLGYFSDPDRAALRASDFFTAHGSH